MNEAAAAKRLHKVIDIFVILYSAVLGYLNYLFYCHHIYVLDYKPIIGLNRLQLQTYAMCTTSFIGVISVVFPLRKKINIKKLTVTLEKRRAVVAFTRLVVIFVILTYASVALGLGDNEGSRDEALAMSALSFSPIYAAVIGYFGIVLVARLT